MVEAPPPLAGRDTRHAPESRLTCRLTAHLICMDCRATIPVNNWQFEFGARSRFVDLRCRVVPRSQPGVQPPRRESWRKVRAQEPSFSFGMSLSGAVLLPPCFCCSPGAFPAGVLRCATTGSGVTCRGPQPPAPTRRWKLEFGGCTVAWGKVEITNRVAAPLGPAAFRPV
ncbi:hypothetical protein VTI74DRAFT_3950 [Chaetomium olivicolor]